MVLLIKLVTGEEIMAKVKEQDDRNMTIQNPVRLILNQKGVGMAPLSPFMKNDTLTVEKVNIVYTTEPDDELANAYNGQFGGIVVAPPGIALG